MTYPEGIDISGHQEHTPKLDGLAFVFVRACYGTQKDTRYDQHAKAVRDAGLVLGAYCFGRFMSGKSQADALLQIAGDADLLCLDRESDGGNPLMTTTQAREFIRTVQPHKPTVLYASESGYPKDAFGADLRWIANWSREPKAAWDFWQYQGVTLDRDRFHGTVETLRGYAGHAPAEGDAMTNLVPLTTHRVVDLKAGTVLTRTPGGDPFTHLAADVTLGLLGATPTHYHVADGDHGVYVPRADVAAVRTQDMNVGA